MRPWLALVLLPLAAACAPPEGSLTLHLLPAGFEDPYQGVSELYVRVLSADLSTELQQLTSSAASVTQGALELGLTRAGEQRLDVQGRSGGVRRARGVSRVLTPAADTDLEEAVPFSTPRVAAALPASRALSSSFAVDGSLHDWHASPALLLNDDQRISGPAPSLTDLRAELALAWEPDMLYFALRVTDDCPAMHAGLPAGTCGTAARPERVAFGFDGADDGGDPYGAGDLWVEVRATSLAVLRGVATRDELAVVMAPFADGKGWVLEGSIRLAALGRSAVGVSDHLGFDLVLYDEDPGQDEPTVLRWSGGTDSPASPTPPWKMGTLGFGDPAR